MDNTNTPQSKLRSFFSSPLFLIAAQILLTAAIVAGAVFYTYATVIVYRLWKIVLIDIAFVISCGLLFALTYFEKHPDCKLWHLVFPFLIGSGVLSALYFGVQAILPTYVNRTISCFVGISIVLAFDVACVVAQDIFAVKRDRKFYLVATIVLVIGVYVGTLVLSAMSLPHGWIFKTFSEDEQTFAVADASAYRITDADRRAGKEWMQSSLAGETISPAFDFSLGGKSFRESLSEWTSVVERNETNEVGDVEVVRTFTSGDVKVTLEANYYDETATVEWKVILRNVGASRTATVSDFYAMDASLPIASPTLYFSGGSAEANDDFALYSRELTSKGYTLDTVKGRTSMLYLPFFNLSGASGGATIGVGWSGEWTASFAAETGTSVRIGQSALEGYLDPKESIRSPLVALSFYGGDNPLKGFNNFRAEILRALPSGFTESSMLMFAGAEGQDDNSKANAAGAKSHIDTLSSLGILDTLDYAWFDAGWYDTAGSGDWRDSIGDWIVDEKKYPDGLSAVSDYLEENGVKTLLWYEPERIPMTSSFYESVTSVAGRESWLIHPTNGSGDCLWNMGDPEARAFMTERIAASLKENGVSFYRQDFNMDPKTYWESADRTLYGGRTGFAENQYVTGEYAFLDGLRGEIPGLLIDNCASGGRRIDLEMCRRSVPLWRSDYQCKKEKTDLSEASQYQLYGLSMWLPYSCITNPNASSEYDLRSQLGGYVMCYADILYDAPTEYAKFICEYSAIRDSFAKNYYPLTSCTPRSDFVAMQFGDEKEGVILVYSRGSEGDRKIVPNGLSATTNYILYNVEGDRTSRRNGGDLMKSGFTLETGRRTAYVIVYKED